MITRIRITGFLFLVLAIVNGQRDDQEMVMPIPRAYKPMGTADDAYGKLNKGELINIIGNYGAISDAYLQNVIYNFTWPKSKGAETSGAGSEDATDDFAIIFATASVKNFNGTGTVIDGYTNYSREDWRGVDGAGFMGHYHCANDQQRDYLLAPDGTPMLATSDLPETWPAGWMDDDDVWPGIWHPGPAGTYESLNTEDKTMVDSLAGWYDVDYDVWRFWPGPFRIDNETGKQVPGEFAGDRHVWCIMDDEENLQGPQVGIVVEMEGICYGRPYAEDFHFYDFTIRNESGSQLDSCWWGYFIDPKFGDVNEEEFYTYNSNINALDQYNVFVQYDPDGQTVADRWREIGVFGMAVLRTPQDVGVTDAHFLPKGSYLTSDWELWAHITGNPSDEFAPQPTNDFFHGDDFHLDDFTMSWGKPMNFAYLVMSGPFSMAPGEKVKATIVVSAGADQFELMGGDHSQLESGDFSTNILTAQDMFNKNFQGPSGPAPPTLYGVPGDGRVTLYWDDLPEKVPDPFSGEFDFEGYKIYRSVDDGATWGDPITDAFGQLIGYVPIVQYDVINDVDGFDLLNTHTYLGSNTGIKHSIVDSLVNNGMHYTYAITAYDRGDADRNVQSFESAKGSDQIESNVVRVTPRSVAIGYLDPFVSIETFAKGSGGLRVKVHNPPEDTLKYQIAFVDSPASTFDIIKNSMIIVTYPINAEEDLPWLDGIQFNLDGDTQFGGVKNVTDEYGRDIYGINNLDTTGNWYADAAILVPNSQASFDAIVADYEIRFSSDSSWSSKTGPDPQLAQMKVPFSVWNVSADPPFQTNCLVSSFDYKLNDVIYIGDNPYTASALDDTLFASWRKNIPYSIKILASPANSEGLLPLEGQKIKISTYYAFSPSDTFNVTVSPPMIKPTLTEMSEKLDLIRVVPNPYVVHAQWETQENERRLRFMFLPGECTISIYTIVGELVAKLYHDNGTGDEDWSLLTNVGQEVAFGVYLYVVESEDFQGNMHKKIGKIFIIK